MNFELWLFTVKRLAQTMDAAKLIYKGLSTQEQMELRKEYNDYKREKKEAEEAGRKAGEGAAEKIVQTAGRDSLGTFAPDFAHFNDDCVKIGLNRKSLIESRFRGAVLFL